MELRFSHSKPARRRGRLMPVLWGILLLQGCFYLGLRLGPVYLAPEIPAVRVDPSVDRIVRWRRLNYVPEHDPALGMELLSLQLPVLQGPKVNLAGNGRDRTLLVFLPEVGCSARSLLTSWAKMSREFPGTRLIGVSRHSAAELQLGCHVEIQGIPVLLDSHAELARALNASWRPRAYLLDRHGQISYVQPVTTMDGKAVLEVERLLQAEQ